MSSSLFWGANQIISFCWLLLKGSKVASTPFLLNYQNPETPLNLGQLSQTYHLKPSLASAGFSEGTRESNHIYSKSLQGITMLTATEADGRVNWVIDLEPLKARG